MTVFFRKVDDFMKEFSYTITDKIGIHARPAGLLVKKANEFVSDIKISKGEKTVDAKKIFGIMSLAAKYDEKVKITVNGEDEDLAAVELEKFFKENI